MGCLDGMSSVILSIVLLPRVFVSDFQNIASNVHVSFCHSESL